MFDILVDIVNSKKVGELSLSKGGWEGWLQCELWFHMNDAGMSTERELKYPGKNYWCDLVTSEDLWVELKAFGVFREGDEDRFLDSVANDVLKLSYIPRGSQGVSIVVVPKAIGESLNKKLKERFLSYECSEQKYCSIFSLGV